MTGEEGTMSNQGPLKKSTEHCIQSHFLKLKLRGDLAREDKMSTLWLDFLDHYDLNNSFLRERGMASNPKMEYQVFFCIFQKNLAMDTLNKFE